jgi:hypothetical protein
LPRLTDLKIAAERPDSLEAKSKQDIIALSHARLGDVIDFEPADSCPYLRLDETVDQAREVFTKDLGKRIFSALVT